MAFKMRKPNPKGVESPLPQDITDAVIDKTGTASKVAKGVKYGTQGSAIANNPIIKNLASKSLGVASLMFDPVTMGTNDIPNWSGESKNANAVDFDSPEYKKAIMKKNMIRKKNEFLKKKEAMRLIEEQEG